MSIQLTVQSCESKIYSLCRMVEQLYVNILLHLSVPCDLAFLLWLSSNVNSVQEITENTYYVSTNERKQLIFTVYIISLNALSTITTIRHVSENTNIKTASH